MKQPNIYCATPSLADMFLNTATEIQPGKWVPARPLDGGPFWKRFIAAWKVFTGRADALVWIGQ